MHAVCVPAPDEACFGWNHDSTKIEHLQWELKNPLNGMWYTHWKYPFQPTWLQNCCLAFVKPWGWLLVLIHLHSFVGTVETCGFLHSLVGRAAGSNIPGRLYQPWERAQRGQDIRPSRGCLSKSSKFEPQPCHCSWQLGLRLLRARVRTHICLSCTYPRLGVRGSSYRYTTVVITHVNYGVDVTIAPGHLQHP